MKRNRFLRRYFQSHRTLSLLVLLIGLGVVDNAFSGVVELEREQANTRSVKYQYTFEGNTLDQRLEQKAASGRPALEIYTQQGRYVDPVQFLEGFEGSGLAVMTSAGGLALGSRKHGSALKAKEALVYPAKGTLEFLIKAEILNDNGYAFAGSQGNCRWRFFKNGGKDSDAAVTILGDNVSVPLLGAGTGVPYEERHWYYVVQTWEVSAGNVVINAWAADLEERPAVLRQTIRDAEHWHAGNMQAGFRLGSLNDSLNFFEGAFDAVALYESVLSPDEIQAHFDALMDK